MIIYECDMCGRQSQSDMQTVNIIQKPSNGAYYPSSKPFMLCNDCAVQLIEFITQYREVKEHEKEGVAK